MRRLTTLVALVALPVAAADPTPNVMETINRGLAFLARDSLAFKETRKCAECHHASFTIWALNEGKRQGYAVDEKALAELTAWAAARDIPARAPPRQGQSDVNEAPLLLALGIERAIMRDGKPPRNLSPITHAGSAWAVLGLIRFSPSLAKPGTAPAR